MKPSKTKIHGLGFFTVVLVLALASASAEGFGVYSSDKEKILTGNSASFELYLVNTAGKPQNILVSGSDINGGVLWIEKGSLSRQLSGSTAKIRLKRSVRTTSGNDVLRLRDGVFVNTTRLKLRFEAEDPEKRRFNFKVQLAQRLNSDSSSNLTQDVVNIRSYRYTVLRENRTDRNNRNATDLSSDQDLNKSEPGGSEGFQNFFQEVKNDFQISFGSENSTAQNEPPSIRKENSSVESSAPKSGSSEKSETGGVNSLTYLLALGLILSTFYLFKVI